MNNNDFRKYATKHLGMNGLSLDEYFKVSNNGYISPSILEEPILHLPLLDYYSVYPHQLP
jgi:ATP-dependent Clp protease protease subunit